VVRGYFDPKKEQHYTRESVETFSDAFQLHFHYDNGKRLAGKTLLRAGLERPSGCMTRTQAYGDNYKPLRSTGLLLIQLRK
jgi:hypothetical protein